MKVREEIKMALAKSSWTMINLAKELSEKSGRECSANNLSQKLRNETLRYSDAKIIAGILGYELKFTESPNGK